MAAMARLWKRLRPRLTERNLALLLVALFLGMSAWILSVPYDAMKMDLADATTNEIWSGLIREGKYALPLEEWRARGYPPTQSSVVELDGRPYVVNEKGPGHAMLVAALDTVGMGALTGTLCAGMAVLATYMLGRRLFNWRVGFLAALFVLTNLTVIVMWHRYLWTDASTMSFLVLGAWLLAESLFLFRRGSGEGRERGQGAGGGRQWEVERGPGTGCGVQGAGRRGNPMAAIALGVLGGAAFGISISTRYPVALLLGPLLLFVVAAQAFRASGFRKEPGKVLHWLAHSARCAAPFLLGLFLVLVPLMQYNSTYFGGPFRSGYDAVSLMDFARTGNLSERNQSEQWSSNWAEGANNVWGNGFLLAPILLLRMPVLVLVPFSVVMLRRRPEFWLLVPWAVTIFLTYLSLPWVRMYTNAMNIPWEPRYFLPALPALAMLAANTLDRASPNESSDGLKALFAVSVASVIILAGLIPAESHFKEIRDGDYVTPQGPGRLPGPPGAPGQSENPDRPGTQFPRVNLSELLSEPSKYAGSFVRLENLTVREADFPTVNATDGAGLVTARLEGFASLPPAARPGEKVNLQGPWTGQDRNGNGKADPDEFFLNIKNGTSDRIESAH